MRTRAQAMTPETARILARAIRLRDDAADALRGSDLAPGTYETERAKFAQTYIHEQRIINRIVSEATDD